MQQSCGFSYFGQFGEHCAAMARYIWASTGSRGRLRVLCRLAGFLIQMLNDAPGVQPLSLGKPPRRRPVICSWACWLGTGTGTEPTANMPLKFEIGPQGGRRAQEPSPSSARISIAVTDGPWPLEAAILRAGRCAGHLSIRARLPGGEKTKKGRRRQTCLTRSRRDGSTNLAAWGRTMVHA